MQAFLWNTVKLSNNRITFWFKTSRNFTKSDSMANFSNDKIVDSSKRQDHLTVTSDQSRDSTIHKVIVAKITDLSHTVKHLILQTHCRPVPFSFKAGQWIDMFIPGVEQVGGFSITSSPSHLQTTGEFHLAVKNSQSPPSNWVHTQCTVGAEVRIRVGGDFFLDINSSTCSVWTKSSNPCILLLIGGGVGINPLASMIAELTDANFKAGSRKLKTCLMFSAKTYEDLIFLDQFNTINCPAFKPQYFLTGALTNNNAPEGINVGRMTCSDIKQNIQQFLGIKTNSTEIQHLCAYLCGPPDMISSMQKCLTELGIKEVNYEKWW